MKMDMADYVDEIGAKIEWKNTMPVNVEATNGASVEVKVNVIINQWPEWLTQEMVLEISQWRKNNN